MPERQRKLERIAWNILDRYCKDHPKPRLSARIRHRCKLFLIGWIQNNIALDSVNDNYEAVLDARTGDSMIIWAKETIND